LTPELINTNPVLIKVFKGIRPAVVALIVAPVISSAKAAKLNSKTIFIPIIVALLIWSKIPVLSNPILWIAIGGIGGIIIAKRAVARNANSGEEADSEK
jgi:chromate transporter